MYTYKNVSDMPQDIIGIGSVEAGSEITVVRPFENPNFKFVGQVDDRGEITGTQVRDDNTVTDAVIVEDNTEIN